LKSEHVELSLFEKVEFFVGVPRDLAFLVLEGSPLHLPIVAFCTDLANVRQSHQFAQLQLPHLARKGNLGLQVLVLMPLRPTFYHKIIINPSFQLHIHLPFPFSKPKDLEKFKAILTTISWKSFIFGII
jgi:hypothetical protein